MSVAAKPPRTVLELLRITTTYLAGRGADTPRLDAEVLLAHVLHMDRIGLYVNYDRPLQPEEVDCYREVVARRARREPVAYILGEKEFMGRAFAVSAAVLIPRPETELLVEAVVQQINTTTAVEAAEEAKSIQLCDIGTGSGAIAVTLALTCPTAEVTAVDISPAALQIAQENARTHGVQDRITFLGGNLFSAIPAGTLYDCVVSNPPYIAEHEMTALSLEVKCEPQVALVAGTDGLQVIRRLIAEAPQWLRPGGLLAMEIGAGQGAAVEALGQGAGYEYVEVMPDYAGRDRIAMLRTHTGAEVE